jgi:hypothetical protein
MAVAWLPPGAKAAFGKGSRGGGFSFPLWKKGRNLILLFHNCGKICTISTVSRSKVNTSRASEDTRLIKQDIVHHVIERTGATAHEGRGSGGYGL